MERTLMENVAAELTSRGFAAEIVPAFKNNVRTQVLVVRMESSNAAPAIYPELLADMAGDGMGVPETADAVLDFTARHIQEMPDRALYTDRDYILGHVRLAVCNEGWNKERLSGIVHEHIEGTDLSAYPRVVGDFMAVNATNEYIAATGADSHLKRPAKTQLPAM